MHLCIDIVCTMHYNLYMKIIWDSKKYLKLKEERGIDLEDIKLLVENKEYYDILENTNREGQLIVPLLCIKISFMSLLSE